jgi:hypothetical protein
MFEGPRLCGEAEVIEVWPADSSVGDEARASAARDWIEGA